MSLQGVVLAAPQGMNAGGRWAKFQWWLWVLTCGSLTTVGAATSNSREDRVPAYHVPDVLRVPGQGGASVETSAEWRAQVRPVLRRIFEREVYGPWMGSLPETEWRVLSEDATALDGQATRRDLTFQSRASGGRRLIRAVLYRPVGMRSRSVPVFVGLHLFDTSAPVPSLARARDAGPDATRVGPGVLRQILDRGYAVASLDIADLAPDGVASFRTGVLREAGYAGDGPTGDDEPGALGAWAWGLSRFVDYAELASDLDEDRVLAIGHSRMGKAALWAAACDERMAAVISNNSGCGGAALNRRWFGETVAIITSAFPHWFGGRFRTYAHRESELVVDQHQLIALIAPRPVYIASAESDTWADPRGEYLSLWHASPVWRLHGLAGLSMSNMPPVDQPVGTVLRYHLRRGQHDLTDYDWRQYLDFADAQVTAARPNSAAH